MKSIKSYLLNVGLILLIGGISLYFSIGSKLNEVKATLSHANIFWIIFLLIWMSMYYIIDGFALRQFAKQFKKDFTLKNGFINGMSGTLFSGLTPSSTGGQFAQVFVFNNQGIPPTVSSSILMMCFISYQIVLILFSFITMVFQYGYFVSNHYVSMAALGFFINFVVTGVLFLGATSQRFQNFLINYIIKFLYRIHIVKNWEDTSSKIRNYFGDFRHQLSNLSKNKKVFLSVCLCNTLKLFIVYSVPFFACLALHVEVVPMQLFNFIGLASIINLINTFLPIPGASGGSEGMFMILFGFLGQSTASSVMLVWRIFQYYYGLILGMITFSFARDTKRSKNIQ